MRRSVLAVIVLSVIALVLIAGASFTILRRNDHPGVVCGGA